MWPPLERGFGAQRFKLRVGDGAALYANQLLHSGLNEGDDLLLRLANLGGGENSLEEGERERDVIHLFATFLGLSNAHDDRWVDGRLEFEDEGVSVDCGVD
jgi:hypothetical protein